jgi:hypothetical protein
MAVTESQVAAAEIEKVRTKLSVLFDRDGLFYADIEKRDVEVVSNISMRIPLEIRPGGRFGHYNPAGGGLGRGDGPSLDKGLLPSAHLRLGIEYQHLTDIATDDRRKSVVQYVRRLVAKSMAEFRRQVDSLCMTGGDGVLATISTVATSGGKDTYTCNAAGDGFGVRLLRYGSFYSVYDAALANRKAFSTLGTVDGEGPIDLYDLANKQVRFNATVAAPAIATDKLVVSGLTATPPVSILGVPYHHNNASTGTWLGLDRSANPEIRANRVTASAALALTHPRLALNKIGDRIGIDHGMKVVAWMHPCQAQAYEELGQLVSVIQKSAREESLNLYFNDNLQMAGAPVRQSYSWDKTRIDFVAGEVWGRGVMEEPDFYKNPSGGYTFEARSVDGGVAAANIFYIVASFNIFVDNPAACSYISGLTIPTGY